MSEKQSLVNKMVGDEYRQYKQWRDWFKDILGIYKLAKENYLESETKLYQLLWFTEVSPFFRKISGCTEIKILKKY